uniref:Uncharacterized protein n=1 Tax=Nelumbo nucifera TaxID=4432 RepID=A0A822Y0E6_NELNU|nr:TPA_asm: hypothetical protein HUJ06_025999 [Nelumbo nucifera]
MTFSMRMRRSFPLLMTILSAVSPRFLPTTTFSAKVKRSFLSPMAILAATSSQFLSMTTFSVRVKRSFPSPTKILAATSPQFLPPMRSRRMSKQRGGYGWDAGGGCGDDRRRWWRC